MKTDKSKNIIFIGDDIETRIVFSNALSSLLAEPSLHFFFTVDTAIRYLSIETVRQPDIIFIDSGIDKTMWHYWAEKLKALAIKSDCKIMAYGTSALTNPHELPAADVLKFIAKPYDFTRLKKLLGAAILPEYEKEIWANPCVSTYEF